MATLYDEYDPNNPASMPVNHLYRSAEGKLVQCAGVFRDPKGSIILYLSEPRTGKLFNYYGPREQLKEFERVMPEELSSKEKQVLDIQARLYAEMCFLFSELAKALSAGKGSEHF